MLSIEKFGRYNTKVEEKDGKKGTASAKNKVKRINTYQVRYIRGVKRRDRNENVFARPNRLCENDATAIL